MRVCACVYWLHHMSCSQHAEVKYFNPPKPLLWHFLLVGYGSDIFLYIQHWQSYNSDCTSLILYMTQLLVMV